MTEREIPGSGYDSETKGKILDSATELFALKGFNAVSMKDISKAVGIKTASIYYYYESKDALLDDVLMRFEKGYKHYLEWLSIANSKAESLEALMDNMFNKEFMEMRNPTACLGMSLVLKEQHDNEAARRFTFELFYKHSIDVMQSDFDRLIKKGVIPKSDTRMTSTLFMFCVLIGNDIRVHEYMGAVPPIDCIETLKSLKKLITSMLLHGDTNTGIAETT